MVIITHNIPNVHAPGKTPGIRTGGYAVYICARICYNSSIDYSNGNSDIDRIWSKNSGGDKILCMGTWYQVKNPGIKVKNVV